MERRHEAAGPVADVLTQGQKSVVARVLAEEEARREHVVVYLSGAHAYGFPSPDSDLDLKAIHVAKTADLLGLNPPAPTFDRAEVIEGVEIDYTSNELAHALAGHVSAEAGHRLLLEELGLKPLIDLNMRLGEASGAAVALLMLRAALACHVGMATFAEAGVADRAVADSASANIHKCAHPA